MTEPAAPRPAPTDDVAASYFDTLRGSITDPDVLAAAAKAEADPPAPTDDVAALVARLRGRFTSLADTVAAADALERLAADLAAWKRRWQECDREWAKDQADLAAARAEADRSENAAGYWKGRALPAERRLAELPELLANRSRRQQMTALGATMSAAGYDVAIDELRHILEHGPDEHRHGETS